MFYLWWAPENLPNHYCYENYSCPSKHLTDNDEDDVAFSMPPPPPLPWKKIVKYFKPPRLPYVSLNSIVSTQALFLDIWALDLKCLEMFPFPWNFSFDIKDKVAKQGLLILLNTYPFFKSEGLVSCTLKKACHRQRKSVSVGGGIRRRLYCEMDVALLLFLRKL